MMSITVALLFLAGIQQIFGESDTLYFKPKVGVIVCPDKTECPTSNKCCKKADNSYYCCQFGQGVCCTDEMGSHCCQKGETCGWKTCDAPTKNLQWLLSLRGSSPVSDNKECPDHKTQCGDGQTCCQLASGGYGCCPLPNAVCCSDHLHCCPEGTTCDVAQGKCIRGNTITDWFSKTKAIPKKVSDNKECPDHKTQCGDGQTCCQLASGGYGCCPLPNAVCCSDHLHCCPQDTTCDVAQGKCIPKPINWFSKVETLPLKVSDNKECPDHKTQCGDGQTCCQLESGRYGCCPLPNAVCCSDGLHCCPEGTTCDVAQGKCIRGNIQINWFVKTKGIPKQVSDNKECPDHKTQCGDGQTCCQLASGGYGCCPLPNAVCCSDKLHCCPQDTTCDVAQGKCIPKPINWFSKTEASPVKVSDNKECPDHKTQCGDGQTCCQLASGGYGCCPLPNAVCCSDKLHCCPQDTTCDVAQGKCIPKPIKWFSKTEASPVKVSDNKECPDHKTQCGDGQTCCQLASGGYGCCPLPNAVCCSDKLHCCPQDTTCDVAQGKCIPKPIKWFSKTEASPVKVSDNKECPDHKTQCGDGQTCCQLASGGYGCCPLPNAVCCSDKLHCCPQDTTCDVAQGKCIPKPINWFSKTEASPVKVSDNKECPDHKTQCGDGQTCCQLASGGYGCCPLPNAVCCSDKLHCCPQDTTCDVAQGKCIPKPINWFSKTEASPVKVSDNKECPDHKTQCGDGQTCCQLASGGYGCCPLPNAVCCSDHLHCCPEGTTCDVAQGKCIRGNIQINWFSKTKGIPKQVSDNKECPDHKTQCGDGQTCCQLASGGYGCCPLPNAVCCSDKLHCCPQDTTCDVAQGKCIPKPINWFSKTEASPVKLSDNKECPDHKTQCGDGQTCCQLASGGYGCCPLPNAVCCSDKLHCCPEDTTCDVAQGKCIPKPINWFSKTKASPVKVSDNKECPDHKTQCGDGQTCCQLASGGYGCCPLPNAVCCSDHLHCCPQDTTCDVAQEKCIPKTIKWFSKTKASPVKVSSNKLCPDNKTQCGTLQTCCQLTNGSYGCCPFPDAVCCSDHKHCCPPTFTCDVAQGKCERGNRIINWFSKTQATPKKSAPKDVICPDGKSECPDNNTCCKLPTGAYGCCPLPKAVCCSDHLHCCPQNTTCDVAQGKCIPKSINWFSKAKAFPIKSSP